MTKKQITHLNKLNIPIKKYFGFFRYYNYRLRGKSSRWLFSWNKKYKI